MRPRGRLKAPDVTGAARPGDSPRGWWLVPGPLAFLLRPLPRSRADGRGPAPGVQSRPSRAGSHLAHAPARRHRGDHLCLEGRLPARRQPGQRWNPRAWWGAADDVGIRRAPFRAERVEDRADGVPSALDPPRYRGPDPLGPAAAVLKGAADGHP